MDVSVSRTVVTTMRSGRRLTRCDAARLRLVPGLLVERGMLVQPRRSPRVECVLPVYWTRWKRKLTGEVRRVNAHGMFVRTPHEMPVGFMMEINLVMPWGEISCTAVPRFVGEGPDGRGIGIELHVMDLGDRDRWSSFYRRLLERSGRAPAPRIADPTTW